MRSVLRQRFNFTNLVAVLILVFAMSGGAWAANKYLITSAGQIKPSVLKKLKGALGPQGAQGLPGAPGSKGDPGPPGEKGVDGLSVTNTKLNPGDATCKEGGAKFTVGAGAPTFACNGSPWTAGGKLPLSATETGVWSVGTTTPGPANQYLSLSFALPLKEPVEESNVHYIKTEGEDASDCPGTFKNPEAASKQLCIYRNFTANMEDLRPAVLSQGGVIVIAEPTLEAIEESFPIFGFGSWAVTAG